MKKIIVTVFCGLMLIGISMTMSAQTRLSIATDDWVPYEFEENGVTSGFSTEVIQAVMQLMNIEIIDGIQILPFARLEMYILTGEVDAAYSFSLNETRQQSCYFPNESLVESKWVLFIRKEDKGKLTFTSFDDLKGKRIGVVQSYAYTPDFWAFLRGEEHFEEMKNDELNFKMLTAGRIDFAAAEYGNALKLLKELGLEDQIIPLLENPISTMGMYLIFNKQKVSMEFVVKFSSTLKAFKNTSVYEDIYKKYF